MELRPLAGPDVESVVGPCYFWSITPYLQLFWSAILILASATSSTTSSCDQLALGFCLARDGG